MWRAIVAVVGLALWRSSALFIASREHQYVQPIAGERRRAKRVRVARVAGAQRKTRPAEVDPEDLHSDRTVITARVLSAEPGYAEFALPEDPRSTRLIRRLISTDRET